jgi:hypothetical protein
MLGTDESVLGITPSSGPAGWFPNTGDKTTTYDKIYPGELKKIANQYGAKFEPVNLPITTDDVLALPSLNGTDMVDFMATVDWDRAEPLQAFRDMHDELSSLYRSPRGYDPRNGDVDVLDEANNALDNVDNLENEYQRVIDSGTQDEMDAMHTELQDARREAEDAMQRFYDETSDQQSFKKKRPQNVRSIPGMHTTEDVKKRIARIGVPLFTAAGAAALSPELLKNADTSGEEDMPQQYGGGGIVSRAVGTLHKISEAKKNFHSDRHMNFERNKQALEAQRAVLFKRIRAAEDGRVPAEQGLDKLEEEWRQLGQQINELDAEQHYPDPDKFAGGGPVSRSVGSLSRIREAVERSKPKGDEQAWLAGLAAQKASRSEPRLAVGREVREGAGDYGKYMERHAGRPPEAPHKPAPGDPVDEGTLAAFRRYLGLYAAGGAVADPFADAIDGEYEDGDEYLGEDDDFEYYACGGPVAYGLGGSIKKGLKKVGKVVGKVAGFAAPIVGMINPAIGAGLMAGSALLGKATKGKAKQDPAAAAQAAAMGPARIAEVPNMLALQQQAQQPAAGAGPSQLSMLQQANAMQPPMQPGGMPMQPRAIPGANANGLLAQIQQQRMMQPQLQQPVM